MEKCPLPCLITGDRRAPQFLETPKVSRCIWFIFIHTPCCSQGLRTSCTFAAAWGSEFQPKDEGHSNPKRNLVEYWICFPFFLRSVPSKRGFSSDFLNGFIAVPSPKPMVFTKACTRHAWNAAWKHGGTGGRALEDARGVMKNVCVSWNPKNNRGNKLV